MNGESQEDSAKANDHSSGAEPVEISREQITNGLALSNANKALRMVCVNLPWLSELCYLVRLKVDNRFPVAAITRSGLMFVNSKVFSDISLRDATFIVAHEILHIALDTFGRESEFDNPRTINIAHDYVINDLLRNELGMDIPLGGLDFYGAADMSLEQLVAWMKKSGRLDKSSWNVSDSVLKEKSPPLGTMGSALADAGLVSNNQSESQTKDPSVEKNESGINTHLDVIFPDKENELFPSEPVSSDGDPTRLENQINIENAKKKCLARKAVEHETGIGTESLGARNILEAISTHYAPPWELALQRWFGDVGPATRTYTRASRRWASRNDIVMPGRNREGWTLHIVLDTSGSMIDVLPYVLGVIQEFCQSSGVADVHILQCDTLVTVDEWVSVVQLGHYKIAGYGGSDMSPALNQLAEDSDVIAAVVLTDGYIYYPEEEPPFHVLWATTQSHFSPGYGTVLPINFNSNISSF